MKLIGSLAEQDFREGLSKSWGGLRSQGGRVLSILQSRLGSINSAFVLSWTPEQTEDLYIIMVNGVDVVWLETLRESGELVSFEMAAVKEYEKLLRSRQHKIKLAVALDLAGRL
ncbi:hypothetical protein [Pseudomonas entomophila]|uniref:hypothetical protein n=1 Tax=Pseudomonas entomophila TaxID=312306 RepID=UPI00200DF495|nr:hypothetical protein [Pseudomonas entomophila]